MNKTKKIVLALMMLLLAAPVFILAAGLENNYPALPNTDVGANAGGANFFLYAFNFLIIAGIVIAALVIMYQGITILFSRGDVAKATEGKDGIKRALVGLAILFGAYLILVTVNPNLTIIKLPAISIGDITKMIISGGKTEQKTGITYMEIPLGAIIESILSPDSSTDEQRQSYSNLLVKTEEECYLYDKDGNTIDRNNDKIIDSKDMFEGLDMSYCMDELLKATEKKISDMNGGEDSCSGSGTAGPINQIKSLIRTGCTCGPCQKYTDSQGHECSGG
ncbi:MAG: pilin, partial [Candidatus Pacebacteria bacterium]|nr:pilin [Candidatus Paceibacterota bacterium]